MAQPDPPSELTSTRMPGCSAWVTVDDKPLPVYSATAEEKKSIGYIEAVEGARFKVHYRDGSCGAGPAHDYAVALHLDGRWMRASTSASSLLVSLAPDSLQRVLSFSAARTSMTAERPFVFSKLALTEDEELSCKDERIIAEVGSIQCLSDLVLHETSKKARLSHQTRPGQARDRVGQPYSACNYLDPPESPFWTFEFRYRSRALLELEGYAPALPAPTPHLAVADEEPPASDAQQPTASSKATKVTGKKRAIDITIDSDEEENEMSELKRLRAEVAQLRAERAVKVEAAAVQAKAEPGAVQVKEEEKPSLKRVKMEQGGSSGAVSSSPRGRKVKLEVIELD